MTTEEPWPMVWKVLDYWLRRLRDALMRKPK